QVKIRGFRIELGDIESQLLKLPEYEEVAVIDRVDQSGDKYLCAYLVSETEPNVDYIREELSKNLPDYMIPAFYVRLDAMPLNNSGKLNRKALPEPEYKRNKEYIAPQSELEQLLTESWQQVLKHQPIGIDDNYFELGGDSIKAIQIASKLRDHGLKLEVKDLFSHPQIRQLAPLLKSLTLEVDQGPVRGQSDLLPFQQLFFEWNLKEANHYNQSIMLEGSVLLEEGKLKDILNQLCAHHDVLKSRFVKNGEEIKQEFDPEITPWFLEVYNDLSQDEITMRSTEIQTKLDYSQGVNMGVAYFRGADQSYLLFAIHHLVIDGVSWRILIEDLNRLILGEKLPQKTQSYLTWSEEVNNYVERNALRAEVPYWKSILEGHQNYWNEANGSYREGKHEELKLSQELTDQLLHHSNQAYGTEINELLIAALGSSLNEITGREENLIFQEGHGREEILEQQDITRTVGWFTSMYPVRLQKESNVSQRIKETKDRYRKIPNKGVGYGILRYLSKDQAIKQELQAPMEIVFNYLGDFGGGENESSEAAMSISKLDGGAPISPNNERTQMLEITALVFEGSLQLTVSYNEQVIEAEKLKQFAKAFERELTSIVNHCTGKEDTEKTASDFDSEDLSNEELDDIMDMLGDL
ncbi:MAG: non-ribosomal peptide synthetase, partial [Bacteroidetes bacterium]